MSKVKAKREIRRESSGGDTIKYVVGIVLAIIGWWIIHTAQAIGRSPMQLQGAKHLILIELLMVPPTLGFLAKRRVKRRQAARDKAKAEAEES